MRAPDWTGGGFIPSRTASQAQTNSSILVGGLAAGQAVFCWARIGSNHSRRGILYHYIRIECQKSDRGDEGVSREGFRCDPGMGQDP